MILIISINIKKTIVIINLDHLNTVKNFQDI